MFGGERYKLVLGRGFVNIRQLEAESGAKQVSYHLRGAILQAERTMQNIELLPEETQDKLREMQSLLYEMDRIASGLPEPEKH